MAESEAQVDAIAAEASQAVTYVSTDGGRTGFTVLLGNRANTKSAPLRRPPTGGAYPTPDPTPCGRFETATGLSANIRRAVDTKSSWSWTASDGRVVKFIFDKDSLVHESSAGTVTRLYSELQAALRKSLGVRPWSETYVAKTKPEWTPHSRVMHVTTFEGSNAQQVILVTIPVAGKVLLRLVVRQRPAGSM